MAIATKILFGTKVMYDEDDYLEIMFKAIGNWTQRHITSAAARLFKRLFVPHCDLVTCVTLKDNVLKRDLMHYNPNVLELDNYPTSAWHADRGSVAESRLKFVYLGRITEQKGCRTCGEAFLKAAGDSEVFRGSELYFLGNWSDQELIDWLGSREGIHVRMQVSAPEIRAFLQDGHCVGLLLYGDSSYHNLYGTNSLKIYEYLAMGAPVISTKVGDLPRFITEHDVGYVVSSPLSCEELTALFVRISENPHEVEEKAQKARTLMAQPSMHWEAVWNRVVETGFFDDHPLEGERQS